MLSFEMAFSELCYLILSFYRSITVAFFQYLLSFLLNLYQLPLVSLADVLLGIYFRFCGLSPCTINLDDQTSMYFWTANQTLSNKPSLVMIHGYGGNSKWQFVRQVGTLSKSFNLHIPDLLFFGKSYTNRPDRTEIFQAKCVFQGLKRLGVDRFAIYGISYGGFVAYRMAEIYPKDVDKVVIVSCGIGSTDEQKEEHLKKIGRDAKKILVPESPQDLRLLVNLSVYNSDAFMWMPDYFYTKFINVMYKEHKKEKIELLEYLLSQKADPNLPLLTQETLIVWGQEDKVFPVYLAYQLQRHLGSKSNVEIIKDTGHAVNIDAPDSLNTLITSFVLGCS
ncbi:hypothetical protein FEM48_Zijuj01G0269300 [Ziziphus jujuba var. spinosa]|uniref:AB hydrolase-1 domain-containing protein n=1 Tax=Ziziphus jujuba var. spinosa TaxID=714518 RepID=A0A978W547_ZIZJJ|nr:hypothetical protein FEM48_Zijuj01G0269300 [Ziziphus jujuba var. spinosa]